MAGPKDWGAVPIRPHEVASSPDAWGAVSADKQNVRPEMSQADALAQGLKSGVSFGFDDEIAGATAAGAEILGGAPTTRQGMLLEPAGTDLMLGIAGLVRDYLGGGGEATKAYKERRDEVRAHQKAARETYPKTEIAGEVAGGMLLPGGAAARGATLPARMVRGAVTGMGAGGLYGLGEGEGLADTLQRGGIGLVGGGVLGGASAPVVEGAARVVAPALSKLTAPITNMARGAISPRDEAARQVVTAIERDIKADPDAATRLTPQEFTGAKAEGVPVAVADLGGGLTRRLGDVAAIASPEADTTLRGAINARFESQSPRLAAWLRKTSNYPDAAAQQEAIEVAARAANRSAYARASAEAAARHPGGLWDENFAQIVQDPVVQAAIRRANVTAASASARAGFTPIRSPFVMDRTSGRMVLAVDRNGVAARPTLQYWDVVKKDLDKVGSFEARAMARALRDHIDVLVPSYAQARAGAAHFFGAENALEAGQNFVGAGERYGIPAARRALSRMTPQERELFQDGYVSRFVEKIEATGDRRSVLNQIVQSPAARAEITMAIGPQRFAELETRLRVEGIMDMLRGSVTGNSWTARRLYDLGLAGGAGLSLTGTYQTDPKEIATGAVISILAGGGRRINANVMRHVAELLVSNDVGQLAKGVRIVARNPAMLEALRAADRRIAAAGAEQLSNLPAIQAGGVSHAQDNQDQVPRPPAQ